MPDSWTAQAPCKRPCAWYASDAVSVRAYSFHQPNLVRALVAASEGRVRVRLVCDLRQAKGKTKMQLQVLATDIRLATGKSVRDAYMSDNRDVRVGSGLQGLHHAKSVLVLRASSAAELVVSSTNWSLLEVLLQQG